MLSVELNPQTFDLVGMLSGRDYPTLDIEVYFNEALGFSINQISSALLSLEIQDKKEEAKKVSKDLEKLLKEVTEQKFVITLKGIPEKVRRAILEKVEEDHPRNYNALTGLPIPNPKADEAYTLAMWRAYAVTFTTPDGNINPITEKDIAAIHDEAPATVQRQITEGIEKLREDSVKGFEFAAQEANFLSLASPEG